MKIDVKETLKSGTIKGAYNGQEGRFKVITAETDVVPAAAGAAGRTAEIGDVVIVYRNDEGKQAGAIFPLVSLDGRLTTTLKSEALGYEKTIQVGGRDVRDVVSNLRSLYRVVAETNAALKANPEYEAKAIEALNAPAEVVEETEIQILRSMRDAVLKNSDAFVEPEEVKDATGLSQADLDRIVAVIEASEKGLTNILESGLTDIAEISAINDHKALLRLNPTITLTADQVAEIREIRALREEIYAANPENAEGKVYTHIVPKAPIDEEELEEAWDKTHEIFGRLNLRPEMTQERMQGASAGALAMADQTFARWTTVPGRSVIAMPIGGAQARTLTARIRDREIEDSPNLAAVKAMRAAINPEYKPEESVFDLGEATVLLTKDHSGFSVYAWPTVTTAEIDLTKPAIKPFDAAELLGEDGLKALREVRDNVLVNEDTRDIEFDDFV